MNSISSAGGPLNIYSSFRPVRKEKGLSNLVLSNGFRILAIKFFKYTVKKIHSIFIGSKSTEQTVKFLPLHIVFFTKIFSKNVWNC